MASCEALPKGTLCIGEFSRGENSIKFDFLCYFLNDSYCIKFYIISNSGNSYLSFYIVIMFPPRSYIQFPMACSHDMQPEISLQSAASSSHGAKGTTGGIMWSH